MKSKFSLLKKVAVITGGGSGIGKSIAITFAEQGAFVKILDSNFEAANFTAKEILKMGYDAEAYLCDVSRINNVLKTFKKIELKKSIDILVNNAGIAHVGNIEKCNEKDLDKLYNVNVKGVYNCSKACVSSMKNNKNGGVIFNLASIAGSVGIYDRFAYSMTKGAVLSMTYSIAKDYIDHNIRCNSISPARVHTPFVDGFIRKNYPENKEMMFNNLSKSQPMGRMGKPQEIADLALFLCSDESSFITGSDYAIDGGFIKLNSK